MRQNKIKQNIVVLVGAVAISIFFNIFDFHYLEFLIYDVRFRLRPFVNRSPHVAVVNIKTSTIGSFNGHPDLKQHILFLENLLLEDPKAIFYMIDPKKINGGPGERRIFSDLLKKFNRYFIYSERVPNQGEEQLLELGEGFDLKYSVSMLSHDYQHFAEDHVARRAVLHSLGYDYAQVTAAKMVNPIIDTKSYRGSFVFRIENFELFDSDQVFVNYEPTGTYGGIPFEKINSKEILSSLKNKIVIIGNETEQNYSAFLKTVYNRKNYAMSFSEANANVIATLIHDRAIIKTGKVTNFIFTFIFAFFAGFGIFLLDPKRGLFFVVGCIMTVCLISWLLFVFAGVAIGTIYPLLGIFTIYYLGIPYRLIHENKKNYEVRRTLEQMRVSAKSAKVDLGFRIASQVAHDLKSPVMALMTIRSVSQSQLRPEVADLLSRTIQKIDFIGDTLLKKFTKATSEFENEQAAQDLVQIVKDIVEHQVSVFKDSQIFVENGEPTIYLNINKIEIERALNNILINAIEASNGKAHISIGLRKVDKNIEITIEDKGSGIPADIQEKIFQTGFTYGKKTGTGIGLAQAQEAFVKEGGNLELIISKPGQTIFRGGLPVMKDSSATIQINRNVLIVEDVPETQLLWKTVLTNNSLNFVILKSYAEFNHEFQKNNGLFFGAQKFTLITDLVFDGEEEGGFDVIHRLRDSHIRQLQRVYICTSLSTNKDILAAARNYDSSVFGKKDIYRLKFNIVD